MAVAAGASWNWKRAVRRSRQHWKFEDRKLAFGDFSPAGTAMSPAWESVST
ncbi:hypothetical protein AAE478_004088 [Parahypoxylon ruwenzoriense]